MSNAFLYFLNLFRELLFFFGLQTQHVPDNSPLVRAQRKLELYLVLAPELSQVVPKGLSQRLAELSQVVPNG